MNYPGDVKKPGRPKLKPGFFSFDFQVGHQLLSERIRFLRLCHGMSMAQLAQKAGVCLPTNHNIESGKGIGRLDKLRAVCVALDCKVMVTITPNRKMILDHRVLRRDGRIARKPRVKTREEGYRLDGLLGHLNKTLSRRVKRQLRYIGPSGKVDLRLQKAREAAAAATDESPSPSPPST